MIIAIVIILTFDLVITVFYYAAYSDSCKFSYDTKIKKLDKIFVSKEKEHLIFDQRFNANNDFWRHSNNHLKVFKCSDNQIQEHEVQVIVLNAFRKIDKDSYIYKTDYNYKVSLVNTTKIAFTDSWERNCQQAHSQVLDYFFKKTKKDYVLILEDDLIVDNTISNNEYKKIIHCAIGSKVHFLSLMNNGMSKYGYGTQAYLMSRTSYFDFFRRSCFALNSPIPIDLCLSINFNLLVTEKNFVLHRFNTNATTRGSFDLVNKSKADGTRVNEPKFLKTVISFKPSV